MILYMCFFLKHQKTINVSRWIKSYTYFFIIIITNVCSVRLTAHHIIQYINLCLSRYLYNIINNNNIIFVDNVEKTIFNCVLSCRRSIHICNNKLIIKTYRSFINHGLCSLPPSIFHLIINIIYIPIFDIFKTYN